MKDEIYTNPETILKLNQFIQHDRITFNYHMRHIELAKQYAIILSKKLDLEVDESKISYIALAHDMFKEHGLHKKNDGKISWYNHNIPQDLNRYIRLNLDILEKFKLSDFFNTDIQLHPLAAGLFLHTEFNINDPEILYPIFFHSCPIMEVYEKLEHNTKNLVDVMILADKLSSNYIRINERRQPVRIDLDKLVFGDNGNEFNYSLGLFAARLISQGKSPGKQSSIATEYYYNRLKAINPLISKNNGIKMLGGNKLWPKRKSQVLEMQ